MEKTPVVIPLDGASITVDETGTPVFTRWSVDTNGTCDPTDLNAVGHAILAWLGKRIDES